MDSQESGHEGDQEDEESGGSSGYELGDRVVASYLTKYDF